MIKSYSLRFLTFFPALLTAVFSTLLMSCQAADTEQKSDEVCIPLVAIPMTPQRGDTLNVYYNTACTNSQYRNVDSLWISITLSSDSEYYQYCYKMRPRAHSASIAEVAFRIPENATFISAIVEPEPYASAVSREAFTLPVYKGAHPVRGALPEAMFGAQTYEQAMEMFKLDAQLYPNDFSRYGALWKGKIRSGFPIDSVKGEVDSLYTSVQSQSLPPDQKNTGYAVCIAAYALMQQWKPCLKATEAMKQSHPRSLSPLSVNNLQELVHQQADIPGAIKLTLQKHLLSMAASSHNVRLASSLISNLDSAIVNGELAKEYRELIDSMLVVCDSNTFMLTSWQPIAIFRQMVALAMLQRNYSLAEQIIENAQVVLSRIPDRESNERFPMVSVFPPRTVELSLSYLHAQLYMKTKEISKAQELLTAIIDEPIDPMIGNRAFTSLSMVLKTQIFIQQGIIDSAEKYWALAHQIQSPFAAQLFDDISKARRIRNQSLPQKEQLLAQYPIDIRLTPSIDIPLATNKGVIHTHSAGDTVTYLFFVSQECGVCKLYVPEILNQLRALNSPKNRIVLISGDDPAYLRSVYGDVSTANLEEPIRRQFAISVFPVAMAIYRGRVIWRSNGLSESTAKRFVADVGMYIAKQ